MKADSLKRGTHGGARPGAGPKPKPPVIAPPDVRDMLTFLQMVALGRLDASPTQVRAAVAAAQYLHVKLHDGGLRDAQAERAKKVATGKFAAAPAPLRLVEVDR